MRRVPASSSPENLMTAAAAPAATGAAGDTTNPAAPVDHTLRWLTALDLLADDVRYRLPHHGIEQRLHDIADDIRATRGAP